MKGELHWTDKQRKVAQLLADGKNYDEIVAVGFSGTMYSRVKKALDKGQKPKEKAKVKVESEGGNGVHELVGVKAPKTAITFNIEQKKIDLDPLELSKQYRYYQELAKDDRLGGVSFSEMLTYGMQVVWLLLQDIPLTEKMVNAVLYG